MALPRLTQCCCGCTLKTGVLIIGILECIMSGLTLFSAISSANLLSDPANYPPDSKDVLNVLYGVMIAIAVISSMELLFSVFLLIGVGQERGSFFTPWIIFSVVNLFFTFIVGVINVWGYASVGAVGGGITYIIVALLFIALRVYFILVVKSLKTEYSEANGAQNQPHFGRA